MLISLFVFALVATATTVRVTLDNAGNAAAERIEAAYRADASTQACQWVAALPAPLSVRNRAALTLRGLHNLVSVDWQPEAVQDARGTWRSRTTGRFVKRPMWSRCVGPFATTLPTTAILPLTKSPSVPERNAAA
jgi:hypothetical protein